MVSKLTETQLEYFNAVVDRQPGIDFEEMAKRVEDFDNLVQDGLISAEDPLYVKMRMAKAQVLAMRGQLDRSLELLQTILTLVSEQQNRLWEWRTLNNIALVKKEMGNTFGAIEIWEKLLEEELDVQDRVLFTNNLGVAYAKVLKHKKAIKAYFSALELLDDNLTDDMLADLYNNLANVHRRSQEPQKALEYFLKALSLYQSNNNNERLAMIYNNLCVTYNEIHDLKQAEDYGRLGLDYYERYMPEASHSMVFNNLAANLNMQKQYDAARGYYERSLALAEKHNDKSMQTNVLNNLAILAGNQEDFDGSLLLARRARKLAHAIKDPVLEAQALSLIKEAWHGKRDFTQAYLALCLQIELERQISSSNPALDIAKAEAEYLQKRLEAQLDVYREQNHALEKSNRIISSKTQELETKNNLMAATNSLLNRIITIIAHDVRGPVTSIRQALDLLGEKDNEIDREELTKGLSGSAQDTERLINELLELATKYKAGMDEEDEAFELIETSQQVIDLAQPIARQKGITIHYQSDAEKIYLTASRNRFKLILRNLLANAIKFSHQNSSVYVKIYKSLHEISISVCDQGIGIKPEQIEKILSGASVSNPGTWHERGFGMGLVFVLEAVIHTKGKLELNSEPGKGTCFKVIYKLAEPPIPSR